MSLRRRFIVLCRSFFSVREIEPHEKNDVLSRINTQKDLENIEKLSKKNPA